MKIKSVINNLADKRKRFFKRDNELSASVFKNIVNSFAIRGGSIIVGLLLVPLTLGYVTPAEYGVWLTVSSVVSWLSFFDIGLGNGLRNKLSESNAKNEFIEGKKYVSTTYFAMAVIALLLFILFYFINHVINWKGLLNVPEIPNKSLQLLFLVVVASFCVQLVMRIINSILTALHLSALSGLLNFLGQAAVLGGIFVLRYFYQPSLLYLFIVLSLTPVVILFLSTIILFRGKLHYLKPNFKFVSFKNFKDIFGLGGAFFIVQIGALVLFQTDNFIISRILGSEAVTEFNIAFKLFSLTNMVSFIILTPYWSAYSDAWTRQDFPWMEKNLRVIRKTWLFLTLATVALFFFAPFLYRLWIGDKILISTEVSFAMMVYSIVLTFQASHNYIINGIGKIKLQVYLMIISAILNIPLSLFLGKLFGIPGVIYSNVLFMAVLGITFYFQLNSLINKK